MERVVSATEARIHFGEMMRRVTEGQEEIIVERSGKPQMVMISIAEYDRLKSNGGAESTWQEKVETAWTLVQKDLQGRELPPADEIIRKMREERDEYLMALR